MSISILNRGASGGMTASIIVKGLGEADTVTASNGSKTKNGVWNATDGYHEINGITDLGLCTVTATNGEKTTTQDVLIEVIGLYEIEMEYRFYLYNEGDECTDITGGWNSTNFTIPSGVGDLSNRVVPSKNDEDLQVTMISTSVGSWVKRGIATAQKVDLTGFSVLKAKVTNCNLNTEHDAFDFAIASSLSDGTNSWVIKYRDAGVHINNTNLENGVLTLDISSRADSYYIVFYAAKGANTNYGTVNINQIWLE